MLCHHARTLRGGQCRQGRFHHDPAGEAYKSVTPDTCPPQSEAGHWWLVPQTPGAPANTLEVDHKDATRPCIETDDGSTVTELLNSRTTHFFHEFPPDTFTRDAAVRAYPALFRALEPLSNASVKDLGVKNPCWASGSRWRCLPYFYLLGAPKCGTTTLNKVMCSHAEIACEGGKESRFWSSWGILQHTGEVRRRMQTLADFTLWNDANARRVANDSSRRVVFGDASADTFFQFALDGAQTDRARFECGEADGGARPLVPVPAVLAAAQPDARLLVTLREPVARAWSHYLFVKGDLRHRPTSANDFEAVMTAEVRAYLRCEHALGAACAFGVKGSLADARASALNPNFPGLNIGLYVLHLDVWRRAFARDALLVLRFEDFILRPQRVLAQVAAHLDLGAPFDKASLAVPHENPTKHGHGAGMHTSTNAMLRRFLAPFNDELARTLGDHCFTWPDADIAPECHRDG